MYKHKSPLSQQIHLSKFGFGPIRCHSADCAIPVAIATSVSALLTTQPSMMLDCLKLVVMAIAIVAVVQASSGQADDNNSSAAAEQVCATDQECSFLAGVVEIPIPADLVNAVISFCGAHAILDILDYTLTAVNPSTDTKDVLLRGFEFVHSISDSVLAEVVAIDGATISAVLAGLADGGLKDLWIKLP
jgi:hypothetical protein